MTYAQISQLEKIAGGITAVSDWLGSLAKSPTLNQAGVNVTTIPGYVTRLQRTADELLAMREAGVVGEQGRLIE